MTGAGIATGQSIAVTGLAIAFLKDTGAPVTADVVCYGRDTRILTPDGEVAIAALSKGDIVVTASSGNHGQPPTSDLDRPPACRLLRTGTSGTRAPRGYPGACIWPMAAAWPPCFRSCLDGFGSIVVGPVIDAARAHLADAAEKAKIAA